MEEGTRPADGALSGLCRCCGSQQFAQAFEVLSWRDASSHRYAECSICASLNLVGLVDPSQYYDPGYFSFAVRDQASRGASVRVAGVVLARATQGRAGTFLARHESSIVPTWVHWFGGYGLRPSSVIVDVGSGSGALLHHLARFGFKDLTGVDPYLPDSESKGDGIVLVKATLAEYSELERADAVIFSHSLEHLDDPCSALVCAERMIRGRGPIVVVLPIAGSAGWVRYRDMWVAVDAPLHRFLPSPQGVAALARRAGLAVRRFSGRTTAWHYLASEAIRRGEDPAKPRECLSAREQNWFDRIARSERGSGAAVGTFVLERLR